MINKKITVLAILIVSIFAISAVSAADNLTDDVVSTDLEINEVTSSDSFKTDVMTNNYDNATDSQEVLAVGGDEKIDMSDGDILSGSPSHSLYSLSVYDTTISASSSGTVTIHITPCSNSNYYAYDFYFKVYDSSGNQKFSKNLYSETKSTSTTCTISANTLSAGTYTIKLVNYADNYVMDTATLKVTSSSSTYTYPYYSDYSAKNFIDFQGCSIHYFPIIIIFNFHSISSRT